ncbi:MAG: hypothetical protein Q8P51_16540, partial [Ignavibacteria bacterium]|nr:hypothetical protein [Ignavibacteria bacterium]
QSGVAYISAKHRPWNFNGDWGNIRIAVTTGSVTFGGTVTLTTGTSSAVADVRVGTGSLTFSSPFSYNEGSLVFTGTGTMNFSNTFAFASGGSATPLFTTVAGVNINFANNVTVSATGGLALNATSNATFTSTATVTSTTAITFGNLQINPGLSNTVSLAGNVSIAGDLNVSTGTYDLSTFTSNRTTAGGTMTVVSGATLLVGGTTGGLTGSNFPSNFSTTTLSGLVNFDGTGAQTVPALTYTDLTVSGAYTTNSVTLASGTIDIAGSFNNSATFSSGGFITTGNTVNFNGSGAQTVPAFNYNNLTSSSTGARTLASSGTIGVAETLTPGTNTYTITGSTIDYNGAGVQTVIAFNYYNLTISGNRGGATITLVNGGTIGIAGAFSVTATNVSYTTTGNTVAFNGSGAQSASAFTYENLTLNNSGGLVISGNATVNATLTLTSGSVTTGSNSVIILSSGALNRPGGGFIIGNLQKNVATGPNVSRFFEVGTGTTFAPVNITYASVATAGNLTVSTTAGEHPQIATSGIDQTKDVNRYWTLTNSGIVASGAGYTADFSFVAASDKDAGATAANFGVMRYSGTWSTTSVGTRWSDSTQVLTETNYGDFAVGEITTLTWDGGAASNNWGDANNWNPDGVPTSIMNVDLSGANTIDINVVAVCNLITLNNAGLLLTIKSGNSLTVSGNLTIQNGALSTEVAFPAVTGTTSITGGTVGYTGSGAQAVVALAYNNLTVSTGGTKTLGGNATVVGDLNVTSATFDLGTNTINRTASGGILTVGSGATLKVGGSSGGLTGSNFPNNFATITLNGAVEFSGSGSQTIPALNFTDLTSSSTGARVLASSGTIDVVGTFTPFTNAYTVTGSTMDFNGGAQTIPVFNGGTGYNNLSTGGAGTTKNLAGNIVVSGSFTNGSSVTTTVSTLTLSIAGSKTNSGTMQFAGASNGILFTDGTVEYNGTSAQAPAGQTIVLGTYNSLILSNDALKTVTVGTVRTMSNLTVGSGSSVTVTPSGVLQVDLDLDNSGTITNNGIVNVGN